MFSTTGQKDRVVVSDRVRQRARDIVGSAWFRDGMADRVSYARDCWPLGILWTRGGKVHLFQPTFVVVPGNLEELVGLVELARDSGTPIVPYGAGSGVCGGTVPVRGGFTIDLKRFDGVGRVDGDRLLVRAGAGAVGMHLETDLNRRGYTLGHYPSSLYCSTLGGYLAARSAGQLSSRFGKIEDMCFSMEVVAGTAEVVETSRWQPDLTQLFMGSEGTLGIITEGTLRVEPVAEQRFYRGFRFHTLQAALDAIRRLVQKGYRPAVVRLYDEFDSLLARGRRHGRERDEQAAASEPEGLVVRLGRFFGERIGSIAKDTLQKTASGLLRRALGSPLWLNRAAGALPVGCLLIIGFEGPEGLTEAESADAFAALRRDGEDLGPGPGEHWLENRFAISYKQSPTFDLGAFVDTMEVSTTWDNLLRLYHQVRQAVARYAFIMAHFSHVYPEGSSIYFTFAGIAPDGEPIERLYERTWRTALEAVRQAGASVTHHHGAGLSKAAYLAADHRGGAELHELLKARFDPQRIMNPGKLWDVAQVPTAETTA